MFVIRKPESSNKTIRLPNTLIEEMEQIATKNDISFNQLVLQCCQFALTNLPLNDKNKDKKTSDKGN